MMGLTFIVYSSKMLLFRFNTAYMSDRRFFVSSTSNVSETVTICTGEGGREAWAFSDIIMCGTIRQDKGRPLRYYRIPVCYSCNPSIQAPAKGVGKKA